MQWNTDVYCTCISLLLIYIFEMIYKLIMHIQEKYIMNESGSMYILSCGWQPQSPQIYKWHFVSGHPHLCLALLIQSPTFLCCSIHSKQDDIVVASLHILFWMPSSHSNINDFATILSRPTDTVDAVVQNSWSSDIFDRCEYHIGMTQLCQSCLSLCNTSNHKDTKQYTPDNGKHMDWRDHGLHLHIEQLHVLEDGELYRLLKTSPHQVLFFV